MCCGRLVRAGYWRAGPAEATWPGPRRNVRNRRISLVNACKLAGPGGARARSGLSVLAVARLPFAVGGHGVRAGDAWGGVPIPTAVEPIAARVGLRARGDVGACDPLSGLRAGRPHAWDEAGRGAGEHLRTVLCCSSAGWLWGARCGLADLAGVCSRADVWPRGGSRRPVSGDGHRGCEWLGSAGRAKLVRLVPCADAAAPDAQCSRQRADLAESVDAPRVSDFCVATGAVCTWLRWAG